MAIAKNLIYASRPHVRANTPPLPIRGPFPMPLGQAINAAGYTVNATAERAYVENQTVSDILSGKTVPRPTSREKIAGALGLHVWQIIWPEHEVK